ncbi:Hypothetical predicted protein [Mytilus galloprovincialis]|uniref:Integrase catalytic domain-containing protein n=1 Tax=Mytilus galloprovincialis TaxID=29158 RepID=A0A8B6DPZ3_MYTGA|nr:Hypothetical predicted protein [Mytilus galloprovincialis]
MELCHELPSAGHQGMVRTMAKVKTRYQWYRMTSDIKAFVATCSVCNKNKKPNRYGRCPMINYHAGSPMERVHLDFMGPLPKTKNGHENILMLVDQFTKWTECIPLPSQTAEVTAQAAINEFFSRFGYPFEIFSDQGRNFESSLFKAVCDLLQIHKARTTPYRPSANGQVERQNRSLMDAVRCFVDQQQDSWDEHLAQLAGALRASVNRSTGYTPNKLMLGRETNQPAELMFGTTEDHKYTGTEEYIIGLEKAMKTSHEIARKTLKTTQARMKKDYDLRVLERQYAPGDLVMSYKGSKVEEDPKLGGMSDVNNNLQNLSITPKPKKGRGTTIEGIGGTYELVSGVGFVLVEEASSTSNLKVQVEQAPLLHSPRDSLVYVKRGPAGR